ncbi:Flp family type IVb pilin [Rhizobium sp. EC-SD404]|uniref:Flp family type IVb pilin n=1 Tax=Rhizobium sp. EC-SD404 TaxID=2038389 RepID=UPI001252C6BE|nr:Flp family type IVb pilin [Rhizobium sp. EC-SD404]VVT29608.1 Flp family type IVb pilin [Rhizobium sp. EC-SD404]
MTILKRFWSERSGATAIEYGLIAGLISIAIVGGVTGTGFSVHNLYGNVANDVSEAMSGE